MYQLNIIVEIACQLKAAITSLLLSTLHLRVGAHFCSVTSDTTLLITYTFLLGVLDVFGIDIESKLDGNHQQKSTCLA